MMNDMMVDLANKLHLITLNKLVNDGVRWWMLFNNDLAVVSDGWQVGYAKRAMYCWVDV